MSRRPGARSCPGLGVLVALAWCVARLPARWWPTLGRALATLLAPALRGRRRIAARNLELCFPDISPPSRRALADASMAAAATALFENAQAWFGPPGRAARLCEIDGLEHLHGALTEGRGVILLTTHQLPMELAARALSERLGRRLDALARRQNKPCLEAVLERGRAQFLERLLDKKDLRGLLASLRENRIVVLIGDQDFTRHHSFVPFFGIPAATLSVVPRLARLSGAPVLPAWAWRDGPGRYRVEIEPPLPGVAEASAETEAARYMASLERRLRAHPEQYLWQHRRFKTRPPGQPPIY